MSDDAVVAMAEGACRVPGCDVAVAVTGVAGPDTQEGVPAGTVYLGLCLDGETESMMIRLPGDRARVRQFSTTSGDDSGEESLGNNLGRSCPTEVGHTSHHKRVSRYLSGETSHNGTGLFSRTASQMSSVLAQ